MSPEELAQIDAVVEDFKSQLYKIERLSRINKAQRRALAAAHQTIFNLPALLRGPDPRGSLREGKDADAQAWAQLTHSLARVDPDWHTRGHSGAQSARLSIERLVDPYRVPPTGALCIMSIQEIVDFYFTEFGDTSTGTEVERYFAALRNNDRYEKADDVRKETN